jgi:hypothetical protein
MNHSAYTVIQTRDPRTAGQTDGSTLTFTDFRFDQNLPDGLYLITGWRTTTASGGNHTNEGWFWKIVNVHTSDGGTYVQSSHPGGGEVWGTAWGSRAGVGLSTGTASGYNLNMNTNVPRGYTYYLAFNLHDYGNDSGYNWNASLVRLNN